MSDLQPTTDGLVLLRSPEPGDAGVDRGTRPSIVGSDRAEEPEPSACIVVNGEIVGWVDYDTDRDWLRAGQVNVGYNVFAQHRNMG